MWKASFMLSCVNMIVASEFIEFKTVKLNNFMNNKIIASGIRYRLRVSGVRILILY